ncbi:MAG: ATP-binding protein [Elusimicrobia bacterium]|nr:ATP-binding protein [Elusimicrobiota bacterium]
MKRPYVHILFGARQTGKSTLIKSLLPKNTLHFNLADPGERTRLLADPGQFMAACRSLPEGGGPATVFVDEAQTVPSVFDAVQALFDENPSRWRFVLCGSSARKLRRIGANLLPGRSFLHHLYPLTLSEHPAREGQGATSHVFSLAWASALEERRLFPPDDLLTRLAFGELPGIVSADPQDRADLLKAYADIYLEEEIRREALVKDWGAFVRFLRLAAAESGQITNFAAISREAGLSIPTVKSHYELLEDMFVGLRVPSFSKSPRKNILSTPKFLFFDLGVRHAAAGLAPSKDIVRADPGRYFEQWVGLELWKRLHYSREGSLYYQRTKDGAEIDFIVEHRNRVIPIEVKWTEHPTLRDARHLLPFLKENAKNAPQGFVVCRYPRPLKLAGNVTAIPWFAL